MKKALTLIELLIAMILLGVVLLGVYGIYLAGTNFFISSEAKSEVLNELNYVLDHIGKSVYLSTGWKGREAMSVNGSYRLTIYQDYDTAGSPRGTPQDFSDDRRVRYTFNSGTNTVSHQVCPNSGPCGSSVDLTTRMTDVDIASPVTNGILIINRLELRYDPDEGEDTKFNPAVSAINQDFVSPAQSLR